MIALRTRVAGSLAAAASLVSQQATVAQVAATGAAVVVEVAAVVVVEVAVAVVAELLLASLDYKRQALPYYRCCWQ